MAQSSRIQFLYTGGTLGMVPSPHGFEPGGDVRAEIAATLSKSGQPTDFGFIEFKPVIDSSNVTPEHWQHLIDHLWMYRDDYDGFVILHGTNTLAHSAAAVSFALGGFDKPVVFTGSQIPFGIAGSDAPANVSGAFQAARDGIFKQVSLFFNNQLFSGVRATKFSALNTDGFITPNAAPLSATNRAGRGTSPSPPRGWIKPAPYRRHDIVTITATPGMTVDRFQAMITPTPDAIIYRAYGAGEGASEEPGLESVIRNVTASGVPVLVNSQSPHSNIDLTKYAAGGFLHRAGAIGTADMTFEVIFTKLTFLLSQAIHPSDIGKWLLTNLAGEMTG